MTTAKPMIELIQGRAEEWSQEYKDGYFHALFCDPPYHLTSITERFGKPDAAPAKEGVYRRGSKGFMGQDWDGGDIAFQPETWEAFKEVLYPGAFGMAFAASRNWHRLAVAIEDAGYLIYPSIFGWAYGQGFPHATRIDTKLGDEWAGHRYGMGLLKPALEPIIVFQKPYEGRPLDNIDSTGAGALNIDAGRISAEDGFEKNWDRVQSEAQNIFKGHQPIDLKEYTPEGRWPANFIIVHHPECEIIGFMQDSYQLNRFKDGAKPWGGGKGHDYTQDIKDVVVPEWDCHPDCAAHRINEQAGRNVTRFFFNCSSKIDEAMPVAYEKKVYPKEKNAGVKGENDHPTLKPLALTEYLAGLLLPPESYTPRRIFVPFAGVGSEMIGAQMAGWEEIVGVELKERYCEIGRQRIEHWQDKPRQLGF